jgi:hypothetical protein
MPTEPEPVTEEADDDSLEAECRALFVEADEAKERLANIAKSVEAAGHPELATIYREISGTVLTLISDLTATCGGGFGDIVEDVERLYAQRDGEPSESVLLEEDSKRYVEYFEAVLRIFRDLLGAASPEQREPLEALIRMSEERLEFTKEITVDEETDKDDDDEADPEEDTTA